MNFTEFLDALQKNVKDKKIRQVDIARALGTSTSNLSQKFNNPNSEVTISDMEKVQNYLGIQLYVRINDDIIAFNNSKKRQYDENIQSKQKNVGDRLEEIQEKNKLSDEQMAALLSISHEEYFSIKHSCTMPDTQTLSNLKQNFKISIDWLLYGEWKY